ncbi:MAG: hypothetical protein DI527_23400 [Chelatococcus sp.]|nr:MAG: hypothetical protein DI527_23400 [Chelatococcus sp.]
MGQKTEWTCDGCDETAVTALGKTPDNWHQVQITWIGLGGYPSCFNDGMTKADLCGSCSKEMAGNLRPKSWPRHCAPDGAGAVS